MPPYEPHRPVEQQSHSHHTQHLEVMKAHKGHKGRPRLHGLILQRQAVGTQKGKHGHAVVSQVGNPLPPRVHASRASHLPPRHRLLRLVGIFVFDSRPRQPVHKVMAHNGHYSQASQRLTHGQCEHRLLWPSVRSIHRFHFSSIYIIRKQALSFCSERGGKGSARREEEKRKAAGFSFSHPEPQPTLSKGSARREQSKGRCEAFSICYAEPQPTLSKGSARREQDAAYLI